MSGDQQLSLERTGLGARLRAARTEAGMSLDEAAARARVPRRHLAAIEDGDAGSLPAVTYGTAFVRAYAGALGLDRHAASRIYRRGVELPTSRAVPSEPPPAVVERPQTPPARWPWLIAAAVLLLPVGYGIRRAMAPDGAGIATVAETPHPTALPPKPAPPPVTRAPASVRPEQDEKKSEKATTPDDAEDTSSRHHRSRRSHHQEAEDTGDAAPAATPEAAPPPIGQAPAAVPEALSHASATPPARPIEAPSQTSAVPHPTVVAPVAQPLPRAAAPPPAAKPAAAAPATSAPAPPGT